MTHVVPESDARCTRSTRLLVGAIAAALTLAAAAAAQDKLRVAVSIIPLATFVERVGGEHVDVDVLVGTGQSPHSYDPTPKQLESLAKSSAYFRIGIDFENALVDRIAKRFKGVRIVDLRDGVTLRKMTSAEASAHAHEGAHHEGCEHAAGAPDPHSWLSPLNAKIQAATIARVLSELDPQRADEYGKNLAAFQAELDAVNAEIAAALAPLKGREVFVYHPAFGYFLDAYDLRQAPVEINGKEPTPRQLTQLIDRAKQANIKVIFVQPQFPTKSAEAIASAIGGVVIPMDDLAKDYIANLRDMARKIQEKFKQP